MSTAGPRKQNFTIFARRMLSRILLPFAMLSIPLMGSAQSYVLTDLGILPGYESCAGTALNNPGDVVGYCSAPDNPDKPDHSFIYRNGGMTDLGIPPSGYSAHATKINNAGNVLGIYTRMYFYIWDRGFLWTSGAISDPFGTGRLLPNDISDNGTILYTTWTTFNNCGGNRGFTTWVWSGGTARDLPLLEGHGAGINDLGDVVANTINGGGNCPNAEYAPNGMLLRSGGTVQYLNPSPTLTFTTSAINNSRQIAGTLDIGGTPHAALWENGIITDVGTVGGVKSYATAMNASGDIIGTYQTLSGEWRPFLYSKATTTDLTQPIVNKGGWSLKSVSDINDSGQIVGTASLAGIDHAVLLSPAGNQYISPNHGGNTGLVTVTFSGNFQTNTQVKLSGGGGLDIIGTNLISLGYGMMQAIFDLRNAPPGFRDLVITSGGSVASTFPGAFTVEQGGGPDLALSLIGRNAMRGAQSQAYFISLLNNGNVDAGQTRVWLAFPNYVQWQSNAQMPSSTGQLNGTSYLAFDVTKVAAGSSVLIPVLLTAPDNPIYAHQNFQVQVWKEGR